MAELRRAHLQQSDPTIKIIPPYRVRPMGVAKQDKLPRDKDVHARLTNGPSDAPAANSENAGGKPRASSADRTVVSNCVLPPDSNSLDGSSSMLRRMNNGRVRISWVQLSSEPFWHEPNFLWFGIFEGYICCRMLLFDHIYAYY